MKSNHPDSAPLMPEIPKASRLPPPMPAETTRADIIRYLTAVADTEDGSHLTMDHAEGIRRAAKLLADEADIAWSASDAAKGATEVKEVRNTGLTQTGA